jgi:hypothetical protein
MQGQEFVLINQTKQLVDIGWVGRVPCLEQRSRKSLRGLTQEAWLIPWITLQECSVILNTGLPAPILSPLGWNNDPLPLDELSRVQGKRLTSPSAVSLDPK